MSFSKTLKEKAGAIWEEGYLHPFVQGIGSGELPMESFLFYLQQDYKYLIEYAKIFAMGAVKAKNEKLMAEFTKIQFNILHKEMDLHRAYMRENGVDPGAVEKVKQSIFSKAYTSNMMNVAQTGDVAQIIAVIFPCAWTYYDYACRLKKDYAKQLDKNPYQTWIENYASADFLDSFLWFYDVLDVLCESKPAKELREIEEIFRTGVEFEYLFWDMAFYKKMGAK